MSSSLEKNLTRVSIYWQLTNQDMSRRNSSVKLRRESGVPIATPRPSMSLRRNVTAMNVHQNHLPATRNVQDPLDTMVALGMEATIMVSGHGNAILSPFKNWTDVDVEPRDLATDCYVRSIESTSTARLNGQEANEAMKHMKDVHEEMMPTEGLDEDLDETAHIHARSDE